jgi:virginiamycin B lyase
MTPTGTVTEFPLPATYNGNSILNGITTGSDGNLWFISDTEGQIGRMTPTGTVAIFPLPAADSGSSILNGITAGPDGNLWFTEGGTNKIGYIASGK